MQIWLQRAVIKLNFSSENFFDEQICKEVDYINSLPKNKKHQVELWNVNWLSCNELKNLIKKYPIIDKSKIDNLEKYAKPDEINLFGYNKIS